MHWEINRALAPKSSYSTPKPAKREPDVAGEEPKESKGAKRRKKASKAKKELTNKLQALEAAGPPEAGKGRRQAKGTPNEPKGKGKSNLPRDLVGKGCHSHTPSGDSICYKFNLSECKFGTNTARIHTMILLQRETLQNQI